MECFGHQICCHTPKMARTTHFLADIKSLLAWLICMRGCIVAMCLGKKSPHFELQTPDISKIEIEHFCVLMHFGLTASLF